MTTQYFLLSIASLKRHAVGYSILDDYSSEIETHLMSFNAMKLSNISLFLLASLQQSSTSPTKSLNGTFDVMNRNCK